MTIHAPPLYGSPHHRKDREMLSIVVTNRSTHHDIPTATIVKALAKQLAQDYATTWRVLPPALSFSADNTVGTEESELALFDDADQADALGYHDETPTGRVYAKVFVTPILNSGGTYTNGANSISVTLSHEMLEMSGDPECNLWADAPDGNDYARELCDAVEGDAYAADGVSVSNFVLPAYFDRFAPSNSRFDFLSKLSAPFTMTSGGYLIKRTERGTVSNVFGEHYPEDRKIGKYHPASRTSRRWAR